MVAGSSPITFTSHFFERTDDSRLWGELPIADFQAGAGTNTFGVAVFVLHL